MTASLIAFFANWNRPVTVDIGTPSSSDISFSVDRIEENYMGFELVKKDVTISFLGFSMKFYLFIPQDKCGKKPVPVFLHVLNETSMHNFMPVENPDNTFLPIVEMAKRGYGCAHYPLYE